jgi:hypothetical protein
MTAKPVGSLPLATTSSGTDILILVVGGVYHKINLADLIQGLPAATTSTRGVMTATDKANLTGLLTQVSQVVAPISTPIVSEDTITIPAGSYHITLTGTTTINNIVGLVPRQTYAFSYPSGAGLTLRGEQMKAGDVLLLTDA